VNNILKITILLSDRSTEKLSFDKPAFRKAFSRGSKIEKITGAPISQLFSLMNINLEPHKDKPIAAVTACVDFQKDREVSTYFHEAFWIRADPVFLHADLTTLLLFDAQKFSITKDEVAGYFSMINPILAEDGLCLISGAEPSRWYIQLKEQPSMKTTIPGEVNGHDIRPFLPEGKDRAYWIRLANEIQMVLHDCSINQERQKRGEIPINSIWFWGAGKLPDQKSSKFDRVISDDVNAQGLSIHSGIPYENMPADFDQFLNMQEKDQHSLIVLSQGDLALSQTDDEKGGVIFDALLSGLKKGRIKQLKIITNDQHCLVKRSHLYRFWRK